MSSYKVIKLLYAVTFTIFHYIIWCLLSYFVIGMLPDTKAFIAGVAIVFFMQYLSYYYVKKNIIFGIPSVAAAVLVFAMYGKSDYIAELIFIILNMFLLSTEDRESIEYNIYRDKATKCLYALGIIGIIFLGVKPFMRDYLLRFYLLFLVSSIILLRESRRFRYRVKGKKTLVSNISVIITVLLLSTDYVYSKVTLMFRLLWSGISFLASYVVYFILVVLQRPIGYLEYLIKKYRKPQGGQPQEEDTGGPMRAIHSYVVKEKEISPQAVLVFKIIILLLVIFIIILIYRSYRYRNVELQEGIIEEREKIEKKNTKKRGSIIGALRDFFSDKDLKSSILKLYQSFEKKSYRKNIFKQHMTATQLYNVSKVYIEEHKAIKDITDIYNEAKFSQHELTESSLKDAKTDYAIIEKALQNKKEEK